MNGFILPIMNNKSNTYEKYFLYRDFELVQPLYDLGFMLELASHIQPKNSSPYRIIALCDAALHMDSYSSSIHEWLNAEKDMPCFQAPSLKIKQYLKEIIATGSIDELVQLKNKFGDVPLKLRVFSRSSPSNIADLILHSDDYSSKKVNKSENNRSDIADFSLCADDYFTEGVDEFESGSCDIGNFIIPEGVYSTESVKEWCLRTKINYENCQDFIDGRKYGKWQAPHIIPPLFRFMSKFGNLFSDNISWKINNISDGISPIDKMFRVEFLSHKQADYMDCIHKVLKEEPFFRQDCVLTSGVVLRHIMGWRFEFAPANIMGENLKLLEEFILELDPLARPIAKTLKGDLHCHSFWSDGISTPQQMVDKALTLGLEYIALTDHSRSCHLQNGLSPSDWLRQANSIARNGLRGRILHGIEVDILSDGKLDLPDSLLETMDVVIGSIHSSLHLSKADNTARIVNAIESGRIDILAHPTTALIGKPGVPCFERTGLKVDWQTVLSSCANWKVAVEINCFPSRFDLRDELLRQAIDKGCWVSLGTDAHSVYHLNTLKFGEEIARIDSRVNLLNNLSYKDIQNWLRDARFQRKRLPKKAPSYQSTFLNTWFPKDAKTFQVEVTPHLNLPHGCKIIGMDLTADTGNKETGVALLKEDNSIETTSLMTDDDLIKYVVLHHPQIVSIDSPLGYPGGDNKINPKAGIVRVAEHDLSSVGIPAYPALIDSMVKLTTRGVTLKHKLEQLPFSPKVIESYPGAAQDILGIPRKQRGLDLLRNGLRRLGLSGSGLNTLIHDELDAITSAVVGRFWEMGKFEAMGISAEAQLIVPIVEPITFKTPPIIYMCGRTGAGKSTVSRYLSMFYGFKWIKTADIVQELFLSDYDGIATKTMKIKSPLASCITSDTLRKFGEIILKEYNQTPIREYMAKIICNRNSPLVIDSIRSPDDVEDGLLSSRDSMVWFISSDDVSIKQHMAKRLPRKNIDPNIYTIIDKHVNELQNISNKDIMNNESLERLRQEVDDALFDCFEFSSN